MRSAGLFLILILSVVHIGGVPVTLDLGSEDVIHQIQPDMIQNEGTKDTLSGILFKTVLKYYCAPPVFNENSTTILYGNNGWTFPEQDVNLILSYPTSNVEVGVIDDYRITGYQVIMFTDGLENTGYIAAGGLTQNRITLSFKTRGTTVLSYEFWLYGVPAAQAPGLMATLNHYEITQMC